jgi:Family of unknown function (DUF6084)
MPDLSFDIEGAEAVAHAAAPILLFKLRISNLDAEEPIQTVALRCQIQIETTRRTYSADEQQRMLDLFGEPARWAQTLRSMLWTHVSVIVPPFTGLTITELPVPCTFDFNVAAAKYFAGIEDGEVPLNLMFSGTVFYQADDGALQVEQIPWDRECRYRLPIRVWKQMMEIYYPNSAWICLRRDVFDHLYHYKVRHGIPTWEQAIESVLRIVDENEPAPSSVSKSNAEENVWS